MNELTRKLNDVYQYVRESTESTFYRNLYKDTEKDTIETLKDWTTLPFVTRDSLQNTPFWERIFLPKEKIDCVRATSGTSGKEVLITPRIQYSQHDRWFGAKHMPTALLSFLSPHHVATKGAEELNLDFPIVCGDPSDLESTVRLSAKAETDGIITFIFLLTPLITFLKKHNLNEKIRTVFLIGEKLTNEEYGFFKKELPNATLFYNYGTSEIPFASRIIPVPEAQNNTHEPNDGMYWEILDENNHPLEGEGSEGELVVTTLEEEEFAFPYLRYRTGDLARITTWHSDPWKRRYQLLGRVELDLIKLPGGELHVREVQKSIEDVRPFFTGDFELHYFSEKTSDGQKPRIELILVTENEIPITESALDEIAEIISSRLRVGPTFSYTDGVQKGVYLPISCSLTTDLVRGNQKKKYFIRHD